MNELHEKFKISISIAYFFLMIGVVMGNWVARIPDIKRDHQLSDLSFGCVLVSSIFGGLLSFPIVGTIARIYGSKGGVIIGTVSLITLTPIIGFPYRSIWILGFGITGLGFGWGILEVSINTQASLLEKTTKKHWMGLFQGIFSIGCLLGAVYGGICANYDVSPFFGFVYIVLTAIPCSIYFRLNLFSQDNESNCYEETLQASNGTYGSLITQTNENTTSVPVVIEIREDTASGVCNVELAALCAIALVAAMADGSIGDWSTVFMTTKLGMSDFTAAIGYSICALMVAFGRIFSDYLRHHFDSPNLLMYSGILATTGLVLFATTPLLAASDFMRVLLSYSGLAVAGAGVSLASPIILSMAGRLPGIAPTQAIAMVTTPAYLGYLIGPPLIGFLSYSLNGLNWALLLCSFFMLLIPLFSLFLRKNGPSTSRYTSVASHLNVRELV